MENTKKCFGPPEHRFPDLGWETRESGRVQIEISSIFVKFDPPSETPLFHKTPPEHEIPIKTRNKSIFFLYIYSINFYRKASSIYKSIHSYYQILILIHIRILIKIQIPSSVSKHFLGTPDYFHFLLSRLKKRAPTTKLEVASGEKSPSGEIFTISSTFLWKVDLPNPKRIWSDFGKGSISIILRIDETQNSGKFLIIQ